MGFGWKGLTPVGPKVALAAQVRPKRGWEEEKPALPAKCLHLSQSAQAQYSRCPPVATANKLSTP